MTNDKLSPGIRDTLITAGVDEVEGCAATCDECGSWRDAYRGAIKERDALQKRITVLLDDIHDAGREAQQ